MKRSILVVTLLLLLAMPALAQEAITLECGQRTVDGAEAGDHFIATCPANCDAGSIWGTDVYTDDSDICTAAAHAGITTLAEGGTFDLFYVAGLSSHPASEQNGITSSSWGGWDLSFTFQETEVLDVIPLTCDQVTIAGAKPGDSFVASCPAGCATGEVWGTGIYTDESNLCTAAAHAGEITLEDGGLFELIYLTGVEDHPATEQNGIESSSWGSWGLSFSVEPLLALDWDTNADILEAETGSFLLANCPPDGVAGAVWGEDVYTSDSSICTAAVHAGVITLTDGGNFVVSVVDGLEGYAATERNGIESGEWGEWDKSIVVTPHRVAVDWGTTARELNGPRGAVYRVTCPINGTARTVWGTDVYTDDSSVCTAAVHAGLITLEAGGEFYLAIDDGQEAYEPTERNGIETSQWGSWGRSFRVGSVVSN